MVKDKSNVKTFLKRLKELNKKVVEVGILSSTDGEIILIASVHEFGAPSVNIPERSYIRAGFDKYKEEIADFADTLVDKYLHGNLELDTMLNTIGEYAVSKIRRYMVDLQDPPNRPSTIEQKGSSNPLIDTGHLLQSISYRIKEV